MGQHKLRGGRVGRHAVRILVCRHLRNAALPPCYDFNGLRPRHPDPADYQHKHAMSYEISSWRCCGRAYSVAHVSSVKDPPFEPALAWPCSLRDDGNICTEHLGLACRDLDGRSCRLAVDLLAIPDLRAVLGHDGMVGVPQGTYPVVEVLRNKSQGIGDRRAGVDRSRHCDRPGQPAGLVQFAGDLLGADVRDCLDAALCIDGMAPPDAVCKAPALRAS
ncbi:hypothetical protein D3C80_1413180 [compost metagenome]